MQGTQAEDDSKKPISQSHLQASANSGIPAVTKRLFWGLEFEEHGTQVLSWLIEHWDLKNPAGHNPVEHATHSEPSRKKFEAQKSQAGTDDQVPEARHLLEMLPRGENPELH